MTTKQEFINRVLLVMNEAEMYDKTGQSFIGADTAQIDRYIEGSFVDAWRRCAQVMPKAWFKNASFKLYPHHKNTSDGTGWVVLPTDFYLLNSFKMSGWRKAVLDAYIDNERVAAIQSNEYTRGSQIRPVTVIKTKEVADTDLTAYIKLDYYQDEEPGTPTNGEIWYNYINGLQVYVAEPIGSWMSYILYNFSDGDILYFNHTVEDITKQYAAIYSDSSLSRFTEVNFELGIPQVLYYYSLPKGSAVAHTIEEAIYIPVAPPLSSIDKDDDIGLDHRIIEPMAYLSASSVFTIFEKYDIAKAIDQKVVEMFPAFKSIKGNNITFKQ